MSYIAIHLTKEQEVSINKFLSRNKMLIGLGSEKGIKSNSNDDPNSFVHMTEIQHNNEVSWICILFHEMNSYLTHNNEEHPSIKGFINWGGKIFLNNALGKIEINLIFE